MKMHLSRQNVMLYLLHFWYSHPALLQGVAFLLGVWTHFTQSFLLGIPCLFLWVPFLCIAIQNYPRHKEVLKPLILSLFIFFTAWIYTAVHYSFPSLPDTGIMGTAHIKIKNISLQSHFFGDRWIYRSEIQQFFPDHSPHSLAASLPCLLIFSAKQRQVRPLANQEYWISGKLLQTNQGTYLLKVSSKALWKPIQNTWSWAEQRYVWKKKVSAWIESKLSNPLSATFLVGLATGEFDDLWMRQHFSRFGLQHLLAISGFHFAIITGLLSFILRLFLPMQIRIFSLLLLLGAYCFFLGPQASILRAWIMCSLALASGLLEKSSNALNTLGLALLIILSYHPLLCLQLGFQLSFATTAAILIFYSPAKEWIYHLFPKRNLSEALQMNLWNQHAYCILAFFRQGLALTLAVNLFALPITLYYFQQFPWMSLLYNLFFPLLAAGSMTLLLLGSMLAFIPFLANFIHQINDLYTFYLLQLAYQIPSEMDFYLKVVSFPTLWLLIYLCVMSLLGIIWKERFTSEQEKSFEYL